MALLLMQWRLLLLLLHLLLLVVGINADQPSASPKCKVFTFFEDLTAGLSPQHNLKAFLSRHDHLQILRLWLRNWHANGWDPHILSLADAKAEPNYEAHRIKFARLPTVNWKQYETVCYLRWLAFAGQGGGVFVDYDIMNMPVARIPVSAGKCGLDADLVSYPAFLPMLVYASPEAAKRLVQSLADYRLEKDDTYGGRAHISDMLIIRKRRQQLFSALLPNPKDHLWHFASFSKQQLNNTKVNAMTRSEWIRRSLTVDFARRKRVRLFAPDRFVEPALDALVTPIKGCPEDGQEANAMMLEEARLLPGDFPTCDYRVVDSVAPLRDEHLAVILIWFEPVHERVIRPFARSPLLRQSGDNPAEILAYASREANQNIAVKQLSDGCLSGDLKDCLEMAKAKLTHSPGTTFVGFLERLPDSKMLLEYTLGFTLPALQEPYTPATIRHRVTLPDGLKKAILDLNWADQELYAYAYGLFEGCLAEVKALEAQLAYYDGSFSSHP
jgi:hypothetical protein